MIKIAILMIMALLVSGCFSKKEDVIRLSCEGDIDRMELFYTSDTHVYYFLTRPNYVEYNGDEISFSEALGRSIITLDDVKAVCEFEMLPHVEEE